MLIGRRFRWCDMWVKVGSCKLNPVTTGGSFMSFIAVRPHRFKKNL